MLEYISNKKGILIIIVFNFSIYTGTCNIWQDILCIKKNIHNLMNTCIFTVKKKKIMY